MRLLQLFSPLFILSFLLTSCAVGPDFEKPDAPKTDSYTESILPDQTVRSTADGGDAQRFIKDKDIPGCWWHLFHSKPLNGLIERALKNNANLQAAETSLRQAEASLQVSQASLFPFIDLQAYPQRQRFNPQIFDVANPPVTFNLFNATVNVAYTLDIWGGIRRQVESAEAQAEYQTFQVKATYLTLTTNIVTAALTEASLRAQMKATQELITAQEKILDLTKKRKEIGAVSSLDIYAQESELSQLKSTLQPLENELAKVRHGLSVLVGELPSESQLPTFELSDFTLPTDLPLSLPSKLVCQRPDIRAAEALLHRANADIGVATANLFPQLTLSGNYGYLTNEFAELFSHKANVWSALTNLAQPIFRGGALMGKRKEAVAAFENAFAQYRQAVLQGFQNVADTLKALELDAVQLQVLTLGEEATSMNYQLSKSQYEIGSLSYLNLLAAEKLFHQAQLARIQALTARFVDTAALYQALGGGWWNRK